MKTVVLGDIHGRSVWKLIVNQENPDRVVFVGDYFDSFDITGVEQLHNFKDIIEYKETGFKNSGQEDQHKVDVIMLIGNHDYHYFPEIGDQKYSGYQGTLSHQFAHALHENRHHLKIAYQMGEFLFSHAGVSSIFMDRAFNDEHGWKTENIAVDLNEMFKYKPKEFEFGINSKVQYLDSYGDNEDQSPIWIRPRSLMKANKDTLRKQVVQVVGHTEQRQIDKRGGSTGGRYWFIDTLGTSGEYLIIDDKAIIIKTIK
jgi:predicted phosphodiesterase